MAFFRRAVLIALQQLARFFIGPGLGRLSGGAENIGHGHDADAPSLGGGEMERLSAGPLAPTRRTAAIMFNLD